jgi:4-hydroxy-tetrahydrodipicolinate reductase
MKLLILGRGKTGSLVAELARERKHHVESFDINDNPHASALTAPTLAGFDVVVDFTTPEAALENIEACARARKNIVVGSTDSFR